MKADREDVTLYDYVDGVLMGTSVLKNRAIYKNKDGTERVTTFGNVTRTASGHPTVSRRCKTVKALNINDILSRVQKTGGSIVMLPTNFGEE
jgi:predicted enzyme related to lactoylglutathione lyase